MISPNGIFRWTVTNKKSKRIIFKRVTSTWAILSVTSVCKVDPDEKLIKTTSYALVASSSSSQLRPLFMMTMNAITSHPSSLFTLLLQYSLKSNETHKKYFKQSDIHIECKRDQTTTITSFSAAAEILSERLLVKYMYDLSWYGVRVL